MITLRQAPIWLAATLLTLSCTWMAQTGQPVAVRHAAVPAALIIAALVFAPRPRNLKGFMAATAPALPWLMLFVLLVGAGGMVSHGAQFAAMSQDFWHSDILEAAHRRPVLPALAWLLQDPFLQPWPAAYALVWYVTFAAAFLAAWHALASRDLPALDIFAILTGSIFAYLLILPGYTEALTYLIALLCWRATLSPAQKCLAAALMIGGHEVAGGFAVVFLAIEAAPADRRQWCGVLALLVGIYAVGYALSAGGSLARDLDSATRSSAFYPRTAWQMDLAQPGRCLLGIVLAYKLLWLIVPAGFRQGGRTPLHVGCILLAIPLVIVATDTTRVVQFASLSMFAVAASVWPRLAAARRRLLVAGMIVLPSLCEGTTGVPAWGKGLYAVYLFAAQKMGLSLGGMAFAS